MTDLILDYSSEIWKPIPDYMGLYEASDMGRIRSVDRHVQLKRKTRFFPSKILKQSSRWGYKSVTLCKQGKEKTQSVHRAVMQAFIGMSDLPVDHLNSDKTDNRLLNLEYVNQRENVRRSRSQSCEHVNINKSFDKRGKWMVQIYQHKNKVKIRTIVGFFNDIDSAILARNKAYIELGINMPSGIKNTMI